MRKILLSLILLCGFNQVGFDANGAEVENKATVVEPSGKRIRAEVVDGHAQQFPRETFFNAVRTSSSFLSFLDNKDRAKLKASSRDVSSLIDSKKNFREYLQGFIDWDNERRKQIFFEADGKTKRKIIDAFRRKPRKEGFTSAEWKAEQDRWEAAQHYILQRDYLFHKQKAAIKAMYNERNISRNHPHSITDRPPGLTKGMGIEDLITEANFWWNAKTWSRPRGNDREPCHITRGSSGLSAFVQLQAAKHDKILPDNYFEWGAWFNYVRSYQHYKKIKAALLNGSWDIDRDIPYGYLNFPEFSPTGIKWGDQGYDANWENDITIKNDWELKLLPGNPYFDPDFKAQTVERLRKDTIDYVSTREFVNQLTSFMFESGVVEEYDYGLITSFYEKWRYLKSVSNRQLMSALASFTTLPPLKVREFLCIVFSNVDWTHPFYCGVYGEQQEIESNSFNTISDFFYDKSHSKFTSGILNATGFRMTPWFVTRISRTYKSRCDQAVSQGSFRDEYDERQFRNNVWNTKFVPLINHKLKLLKDMHSLMINKVTSMWIEGKVSNKGYETIRSFLDYNYNMGPKGAWKCEEINYATTDWTNVKRKRPFTEVDKEMMKAASFLMWVRGGKSDYWFSTVIKFFLGVEEGQAWLLKYISPTTVWNFDERPNWVGQVTSEVEFLKRMKTASREEVEHFCEFVETALRNLGASDDFIRIYANFRNIR